MSDSAADNVGAHLLGRKPSPADDRDFALEAYLGDSTPEQISFTDLDDAIKKLIADSHVAQATKTFANALVAWLKAQFGGDKPTPPTPPTAVGKEWHDADQLDQGQTGHCVGFGWGQWGNTDPVNDNYTNADGHAIYYECKVIDGEPKAEDGSYVRSGAKAMKNRGRIGVYAFTNDLTTVKQFVTTKGPLTIGTDWMNDMFNPDAQGVVKPTGGVAGGHCFIIVGFDPDGSLFGRGANVFKFQNSWGSSWGDNGYFYMHETDLARLNTSDAEFCAGVEL